jgi:hypothetical protein
MTWRAPVHYAVDDAVSTDTLCGGSQAAPPRPCTLRGGPQSESQATQPCHLGCELHPGGAQPGVHGALQVVLRVRAAGPRRSFTDCSIILGPPNPMI